VGRAAITFDSPPREGESVETKEEKVPTKEEAKVLAGINSREIWVTGFPEEYADAGEREDALEQALNELMLERNLNINEGNPITSLTMSDCKKIAYVEMRTTGEAANGLQLNGVLYEGWTIQAGRRGNTALGHDDDLAVPGAAGASAGGKQEPPQRLFLANLDPEFTVDEAKELLEVFGDLNFWYSHRENEAAPVRPIFEFCSIEDQRIAEKCLNGLRCGKKLLEIMLPEDAIERGIFNLRADEDHLPRLLPSKAIYVKNVVRPEELENDEEYDEILLDIKLECEETSEGQIEELVIPRPHKKIPGDTAEGDDRVPNEEEDELPPVHGVGYAFVLFPSIEAAARTKRSLTGRKFGDNEVQVEYFSETKMAEKDFEDPQPNREVSKIDDHGSEDMEGSDMEGSDMEGSPEASPEPSPDEPSPGPEFDAPTALPLPVPAPGGVVPLPPPGGAVPLPPPGGAVPLPPPGGAG